MSLKIDPIYINVVLLNKDEVIQTKVESATGGGFLGFAVSFAANAVVSEEVVISGLASTLKEKLETAVADMGITAEVTKKFQKGAYVVMKVQITAIDALLLMVAAKGPEFASAFTTILASLRGLGLEEKLSEIDIKLNEKVFEAMMLKLQEILPVKMAEAGLHVTCTVCRKETVGEILFDILDHLGQ